MKSTGKLSADELENVTGGASIPKSHEEIDENCDLIQMILDKYGQQIGMVFMEKYLPEELKYKKFVSGNVDNLRKYMHDRLNGDIGSGWVRDTY